MELSIRDAKYIRHALILPQGSQSPRLQISRTTEPRTRVVPGKELSSLHRISKSANANWRFPPNRWTGCVSDEEHDLYLTKIFAASPLLAFALCIALATILWCILLARRQRNRLDKILTGLLGLIAVYEALRILRDSGFPLSPMLRDAWTDFVIAGLCLVAALILRVSSIDRATTKAQLRLVEANEKSVEVAKGAAVTTPELIHSIFDASPLAAYVVDVRGTVTYWNTAAAKLTGWRRDEMIGSKLPFPSHGPIVDKSGQEVEAAVWSSFVDCSPGTMRGFLMIVAGRDALEAAIPASGQPDSLSATN